MTAVQRGMSSAHVFLTRPEGRNGTVPERLRALGMAVSELPALELRPMEPDLVPQPYAYDLVVFVSRYAVQRYFQLLARACDGAPAWPAQTLAATVGASSAHAALQAGIPASSVVHPPVDAPAQDSEALLELLMARGAAPQRVLVVRGTEGREWLARSLSEHGAQVDFLPVYERVPAPWPADTSTALAAALQTPARCIFLLTSSDGVRSMVARMQSFGLVGAWSECSFVVIHERIAATLQSVLAPQQGSGPARLALCMPEDDSIVQAIHAVASSTAKP